MLAVYADVFFRAKALGAAEASKARIRVLANLLELEGCVPPVTDVLVDINKMRRGEEEVFADLPLRRVVGFCGHAQKDVIAWGQTFCDEVWPKSRLEAELPRLLLESAVECPEDKHGHKGGDGDEGEKERREKRRDGDAAGRP